MFLAGEVIDLDEAERRAAQYEAQELRHTYIMTLRYDSLACMQCLPTLNACCESYGGTCMHDSMQHAWLWLPRPQVASMHVRQSGRQYFGGSSACSSREVIDATRKGGPARFLNHSCAPNCATEKWLVAGELCVGIFARKQIAAGEEVTYDYRLAWNGGRRIR